MFITIEGGEGAGKSSLIKLLAPYLEEKFKREVVVTREPGGIEIAEEIRSVILDVKNTAMDGKTEALLYAAARRQHLVEKVLPALAAEKIVICDRFVDSSLAYQGKARDLGMEEVWQINEFAIGTLMPELTLYLDIEPELGLKRIAENRADEINRLDNEKIEFHNLVRAGFLELLAKFPERIKKVDASLDLENVFKQTTEIIDETNFNHHS
ncbi:MAG: dTMP kinase [Lactobacillales bacterium]|jgi:dTMP kinase|nr:dTMP kinase [Lactobacillales bacterium]